MIDKVKLTGLAPATLIAKYIKDGAAQDIWWNVTDLGYLTYQTAQALAQCKITGKEGEKFTAGRLGEYTIGAGGELILGPAKIVTPTIWPSSSSDPAGFEILAGAGSAGARTQLSQSDNVGAMMKLLLAGETFAATTSVAVGGDVLTSATSTNGATAFNAALASEGIAVTQIGGER